MGILSSVDDECYVLHPYFGQFITEGWFIMGIKAMFRLFGKCLKVNILFTGMLSRPQNNLGVQKTTNIEIDVPKTEDKILFLFCRHYLLRTKRKENPTIVFRRIPVQI